MAIFTEQIRLLIDAKTSGATQPLSQLEQQAKKTDSAWDRAAKNIGISGNTLKAGLVAGAGALLGAGLVQGVQKLVTGYADAAKAAGDLAAATGSSVEELTAMQAALQDAGISAETSAGLLTKFTTSVSTDKGRKALEELNVELVKGADGMIDYTATMVDAVDAILQIGDASERNRQLVALFGKQGSKVFQDLIASGLSLSEAMAAIDTGRIMTDEDIAKAAAYDEAMDNAAASGQELGNTIGRTLLPVLTTMADVIEPLVDLIAGLDGGTLLLGGTAILAASNWGRLASAAGATKTALGTLGNAIIAPLSADFSKLSIVAGDTAEAIEDVGKKGSKLRMAATVTAVIVAWELVARAIEGAQDNLEEFASTSETVTDQMVADYAGSLSLFERWGLDVKDFASNWTNFLPGKGLVSGISTLWSEAFSGGDMEQRRQELEDYKQTQRDAAAAAGAYAEAQLDASDAQDALNQAAAEYLEIGDQTAETMQAVVDAAILANDATLDQKQATELATIAQGEYAVSLQETVKWQEKLAGLVPSIEEGLNGIQEAYKKASETQDNPQTWGDEALIESGKAQQAVWDYVGTLADSGLTDEEIITQLIEIKTAPGSGKQLDADIDDIIATISGKENEIPINLLAKADETQVASEVAKINEQIAEMYSHGVPMEAMAGLVAERDKLLAPLEPTTQEVTLTGPGGEPLPDSVDVTVNMDTSQVSTAKTAVDSISEEAITIPLTVSGIGEQKGLIHSGLTDEQVTVKLAVGNIPEQKAKIHSGLTDEKVTVQLAVSDSSLAATKSRIHSYLTSEAVTIRVQADVSAARGSIAGLNTTSAMGYYLSPTATAAPTGRPVAAVTNNYSIEVSGAGSPAVTAREIDRYLRRSGDRTRVSVTA